MELTRDRFAPSDVGVASVTVSTRRAIVRPGDAVRVKASRIVGLERVAEVQIQTREDAP